MSEGHDADRTVVRAIEAVLMASPEPVEASVLAQLLELPKKEVEAACEALVSEYADAGRGFVVVAVAGGYRFQTHPEMAPYVERYVLDGQQTRLSPAALETLAIVAYKQPVSRAQMAAIRGVNVDRTVTTLLERGYIEEVGRDPGPGNAVLYGTTREFLEHLGLDSVASLPPLHEFVPGAETVEVLEKALLGRSPSADAAEVADTAGPDEAGASGV
ncbi:MAG TPA: SMC-Scp complex subunit ScpB [Acidimicrobiia bacterium]|nr:SMC-Scp complex subunit ScpB [Acidimicrobiia bacterium]